MSVSVHEAFSSLPDEIAQSFISTDPSLSAKTDIQPILWENLKTTLFAIVMSLQGVITNIMHSTSIHGISPPKHKVNFIFRIFECFRDDT